MPSLEVDNYGIEAVTTLTSYFEEVLDVAASIKPTATIEPALEEADLRDVLSRLPVPEPRKADGANPKKNQQFAAIETAARGMLSNLIATTSIDSPDFVKVWNLFDVLSILSDKEKCDAALLLWLVEELLDSQTIAGCRKIFDYLDSRRKRIISKRFSEKKLIILRSCNELLRRLSRAEDTAFSGRVFIFLFQSFPLGDKSSVNLRGEYHTQNVTIYDATASKRDEPGETMDVDAQPDEAEPKSQPKAVSFDAKTSSSDKPFDPDALYPAFWSLQDSFNQPKKLFDAAHFGLFRAGLEATMAAFRSFHTDQESTSRPVDDAKRGTKRKRDDADDDFQNAFNPKYLTSRDLFELEISDLSFRRHVLVQALIIMDFLLSLSPKAKEQLAAIPQNKVNKSVAYLDHVLSEDDTKWVTDMKRTITDYLKQGSDGQYFYRMVDTVLSRDRNWVRWKVENCPPIEKAAVSAELFAEAKKVAGTGATNKRLRPAVMGAMSLDFLSEGSEEAEMEKLQAPERYRLPELESFRRKIADDDFEIEMPTNDKTKAAAVEGKASKTWRALRVASKFRLAAFDKIDSDDKIDVIFEVPKRPDEEEEGGGDEAGGEEASEDAGKEGEEMPEETSGAAADAAEEPTEKAAEGALETAEGGAAEEPDKVMGDASSQPPPTNGV